jgi:hypothetical protein
MLKKRLSEPELCPQKSRSGELLLVDRSMPPMVTMRYADMKLCGTLAAIKAGGKKSFWRFSVKVGDIVTYKQRGSLGEHPTPFRRLGTIVSENGKAHLVPSWEKWRTKAQVIFEVYWWDSKNTVSYTEEGLDHPSLGGSQ